MRISQDHGCTISARAYVKYPKSEQRILLPLWSLKAFVDDKFLCIITAATGRENIWVTYHKLFIKLVICVLPR